MSKTHQKTGRSDQAAAPDEVVVPEQVMVSLAEIAWPEGRQLGKITVVAGHWVVRKLK